MSDAQIAVQSCHACIEAAHSFKVADLPQHPNVIILQVKNEEKLYRVQDYLSQREIRFESFIEPDIGDQITAIATEPISGDSRQFFKRFQLYSSSKPICAGGES